MTTTTKKKPIKRQTDEELMTAAFSITHKMHALDKAKVGLPRKSERRAEIDAEVASLRGERDIIVREVKRRAGEED
jgi:hypothetical protein